MDIGKKAYDLLSLEGKVAVISGGASGIGLGTAKRLAEFGARVAILDINEDNGAKSVGEIEKSWQEDLTKFISIREKYLIY